MLANLLQQFGIHAGGVVFGIVVGALISWLIARWKRRRQRLSVLEGDARDTVVINHHLVDAEDAPNGTRVPRAMRVRSLGQAELPQVVPNGHLAAELLRRAFEVTPRNTLISMEDAEGTYLLETLTNFVCDRVANEPFEHDLYVMAPCCEPAGLAEHQPITILLIAVKDLPLFESWTACREVQTEHGQDGVRVLTLMELANRFRKEQEKIAALRQAGNRTRYVETMFILDLSLDQRTAPIPLKRIPWGRFENVLKNMNLE
jgi:hypothetical protein